MKKLLFIIALGVAGLASAKENLENINSKEKKINAIKNVSKSKKVKTQCGVFHASCTSAYTCQDWTESQWLHWMEQIQENYCQLW